MESPRIQLKQEIEVEEMTLDYAQKRKNIPAINYYKGRLSGLHLAEGLISRYDSIIKITKIEAQIIIDRLENLTETLVIYGPYVRGEV